MRRIAIAALALVGLIAPALAADNYAATQGAGTTYRAKDIGAGLLLPYFSLSDGAGNTIIYAQGATTSGQSGIAILCRTLTAAPTDTTAQSNIPSCTTAGELRVNVSGGPTAANQTSQITQETATAAVLGTTADAAAANGAATATLNAVAKGILTAAQAAIPAGEAHIGEVGGNQIRVQVAQTVTSASAYTSGNAVGGLMTVANAARVSAALGGGGSGGILQNVAVNSKSLQTAAMEVWIFDANPSGSTCTDKTAFSLATADFDKVIGVAQVPTTAANNSGWFAGTVGSVGQANNQAMAYDLSSATSLFACMVTRGTPTFTATTDISLKFNLLRN